MYEICFIKINVNVRYMYTYWVCLVLDFASILGFAEMFVDGVNMVILKGKDMIIQKQLSATCQCAISRLLLPYFNTKFKPNFWSTYLIYQQYKHN
jgi:hypothetical protein